MTDHVLRSSPASPFGRKVKIAAAVLGLADRIQVVKADTTDPEDSLRAQNPLGKIPALITPGGDVLFDSRVILEYLDYLAGGGRLIPADPADRFASLRLQALADGIMDAALLRRYETAMRQTSERSPTWDAHQAAKIDRSLAALEASPPAEGVARIGEIAVACALGYLDLRFEGTWRQDHPALVEWLGQFERLVPSFEATRATP